MLDESQANSSVLNTSLVHKKKFSMKELAHNYKKAKKRNLVKQLQQNKLLSTKVSSTLQQASLNRVNSYIDELIQLFEKLK